MKILLIGTVRSRSSYLLDILCKYYGCNNLFEDYDRLYDIYLKRSKNTWINYHEYLQKQTDFYFSNYQNFGIKFPTSIFHQNNMSSESSTRLLNFNYGKFDKIFVTYRQNKVDLLCSYLLAKQKNQSFLYTKSNIENVKNFEKSIYLQVPNDSWFDNMFQSFSFVESIPTYFNDKQIPYTLLEYNDINNFVSTYYNNIISNYHESNIDYKSIISNYSQISDACKKY